jgi:hypothetical protein
MAFRKITGRQTQLGVIDPCQLYHQRDTQNPTNTTNISNFSGGCPSFVDETEVVVGNRILVNSQNDIIENGIYIVTDIGTGNDDGTWVRADDMQVGQRILAGTAIQVYGGSWWAGHQFFQNTTGANGNDVLVGTEGLQFYWGNYYGTVSPHDSRLVTPAGAINGVNKVFVTPVRFWSFGPSSNNHPNGETITVYLNGMALRQNVDYTHDGWDTITLTFAPKSSPGNPDFVQVRLIENWNQVIPPAP